MRQRPHLQPVRIGALRPPARYRHQRLIVPALQPVLQHWAIHLGQDVHSDLHYEVRAYAQDVGVVRRMVDLAHGQAVSDYGLSAVLLVGHHVRGVQQPGVPDVADGASLFVRPEHGGPKSRLVDAVARLAQKVVPQLPLNRAGERSQFT